MFRANPQRTGTHNGQGPTTRPKWEMDAEGGVISEPFVSDSSVYIGKTDSTDAYQVCAMEPNSGKKKWCSEQIGIWDYNSSAPQPTAQGNIVFVSNTEIPGTEEESDFNLLNYECALDARTGERMWCNQIDFVVSYTIISDGVIYNSGRTRTFIHALDAETGKELWRRNKATSGSLALKNGTLYATTRFEGVVALNPKNGNQKWAYKPEERIYKGAVIKNETVYFGGGPLHAVDAQTGTLKWKYEDIGFDMPSAPTIKNGTVYVGGSIPDVSNGHHLVAIDAETGNLKWQYAPEDDWVGNLRLGKPAVGNNKVFVPVVYDEHAIYAFDMETGEMLWKDRALGLQNIYFKYGTLFATGTANTGVTYYADGSKQHENYGGYLEAYDPEAGKLRWNILTDGDVYNAPIMKNDMIYVTSRSNTYAADIVNFKWKFKTGGEVWSSPAVVDGTVFVGSDDQFVYALSAATGKQKWRFKTDGPVKSSPAVANGSVYIGSHDGRMYALDVKTGQEQWNYNTGGDIKSSPVVVNGILYFGSPDGNLIALNARTGEEEWKYKTGGEVWSSPAVANGTVYAGSTGGSFYALDAQTGNENWDYGINSKITWSTPAVRNEKIYIGSLTKHLWAFDLSGDALWRIATGQPLKSSPAISEEMAAIGRAQGNLLFFKPDDGELEEAFTIPLEVVSSPAIVDGVAYIGGRSGLLYAVDANKSSLDWRLPLNAPVTSSPAVSGGSVYVGSHDGFVYAIE